LLRDEGGLDYKAAIADTIIAIIEENPDAKEAGLSHLCEFIEDCEHTSLAVRILHLLGKEGPKAKQPQKYIRYIYNRVILEQPAVRAAAVSALAQFAAHCPALLPNILILLMRCQMDTDDEVRDRATLYYQLLSAEDRTLANHYILNSLQTSLIALEKALANYIQSPSETPFDIKDVPLAAAVAEEPVKTGGAFKAKPAEPKKVAPKEVSIANDLVKVPELARIPLGGLFKTCEKQQLTESETEYVVTCVKHVFNRHVVLQFNVQNTLPDQLLENVRAQVEVPEGYNIVSEVSIPSLPYGTPGVAYTVISWPSNIETASAGTISTILKFVVKDCDPDTGLPDSDEGYDDEYVVEDVDINLSDHVVGISRPNFTASWEELKQEREETFALSNATTIPEAVKNIVGFLGMQPCDRTDRVPEGKSSHMVALAGMFRGGIEVLARAKLVLSDEVNLQLTVRSSDETVAELITASVG
jgi:coatomer protein complex subunit gamma